LSDNPSTFFNNNDWKISAKQKEMLYDTICKMSKKEASLTYKLMRAVIENRVSNISRASEMRQEKISGNGGNAS